MLEVLGGSFNILTFPGFRALFCKKKNVLETREMLKC